MKKKNIIIQIVMVVMVMIVVVISVVSFQKKNKQQIIQQNMNWMRDNTAKLVRQIDDALQQGQENIQLLSMLYGRTIYNHTIDVQQFELMEKNSVFDYMEYIDKDGIYHNVIGESLDVRKQKFYVDAMAGITGTDVLFESEISDEVVLVFYTPVYKEKEIIGVLLGVYQTDGKFVQALEQEYQGCPVRTYLCLSDATIVCTNRKAEKIYSSNKISVNGWIRDEEFRKNINLSMQREEDTVFTYGKYDVIACCMKVAQTEWYLVTLFSEELAEQMFAEVDNNVFRLAFILVFVFGLFGVLGIVLYSLDRRRIEDVAAKSGNYKNAVISGSMIAFEANLTKNMINEGTWLDKEGKSVELKTILGFSLPYSYDKYVKKWAECYVVGGYKEEFLEKTDRHYLLKVFRKGQTSVVYDYKMRSFEGEEIFARRSIYLIKDEKSGDIIQYCNIKDVTTQKSREEMLVKQSTMDELTKCYNRKAYEGDIRLMDDDPRVEELIYISFDVNGLKTVNDTMGHAGGDELIKGAANSIKQCFGAYGKVYRTGGDEFVAMIYADEEQRRRIFDDFELTVAQWRGYKVKKLAVSAGFAAKRDHPDISLFDLAKIADEQMYLTKERYYQKRGIDRRGQQEALKAVTSLYIEIVKINITKDSYKLIQSSRDQFIDEVENYEHISDCFRAYGESDDMYSEDKEQFFAMTDIDFLRRKFAEGAQTFMIQFRRLSSDGTIKTVILELVRSEQYTDEEQILFLFIKCVC